MSKLVYIAKSIRNRGFTDEFSYKIRWRAADGSVHDLLCDQWTGASGAKRKCAWCRSYGHKYTVRAVERR